MKSLQTYLMFPGTCEEALAFYADCLDGEIPMLQRYSEAPIDMPEEVGERVFNSMFRAGDIAFMASDHLPDQDLAVGENFAMFVTFTDADEQARAMDALSEGGKALMPLEGGFGMLQDRYGIRWMLAFAGE